MEASSHGTANEGKGAVLWVGIDRWPAVEAVKKLVNQHSFDPWEGLAFEQIQVGGFHTIQKHVFGLKLHVPSDDPLARLAFSYMSTGFPGFWLNTYATPLEEVVLLKQRLSDLGVLIDSIKYPESAEAYFPLDANSAWDYAQVRKLLVFEHPHRGAGRQLTSLEAIGLSHWDDVNQYLAGYWSKVTSDLGEPSVVPNRWLGVLNCANSD